MSSDILKGQWKQLRGSVKDWWGKLTDNDVERIDGNRDKLVGALQERYGWTRAQAQGEVDRRLADYHQNRPDSENQDASNRPPDQRL